MSLITMPYLLNRQRIEAVQYLPSENLPRSVYKYLNSDALHVRRKVEKHRGIKYNLRIYFNFSYNFCFLFYLIKKYIKNLISTIASWYHEFMYREDIFNLFVFILMDLFKPIINCFIDSFYRFEFLFLSLTTRHTEFII